MPAAPFPLPSFAFKEASGCFIGGGGKQIRLSRISIPIHTACDKLWRCKRSVCAADERTSDIPQQKSLEWRLLSCSARKLLTTKMTLAVDYLESLRSGDFSDILG